MSKKHQESPKELSHHRNFKQTQYEKLQHRQEITPWKFDPLTDRAKKNCFKHRKEDKT